MRNAKCKMQNVKKENLAAGRRYLMPMSAAALLFCTLHFAFCISAVFGATHRYHTSLTRMDYNSQEKTVEISIQLFTHDLVPVLERKSGKQIDLEQTENVDKLILDYLNENFILKNKNDERAELKWVGKEFDVDQIYVYVEIPYAGSLENAVLQNTIFFESFAEQTNLVICRFEQKKADLLFKVGDSSKEIKVRVAGG